jgi:hypothetical protein
MLVHYDPESGGMRTLGPYKSTGTLMKDGHMHIALPVTVMAADRGARKAKYFRADHIAWMLATGEWPSGWIEHVNGVRPDSKLSNLVHLDADGRRWWHHGTTLVEVEGDGIRGDGPITYRVMHGDEVVVVPRIKGELSIPVDEEPEQDVMPEFGVDWGVTLEGNEEAGNKEVSDEADT